MCSGGTVCSGTVAGGTVAGELEPSAGLRRSRCTSPPMKRVPCLYDTESASFHIIGARGDFSSRSLAGSLKPAERRLALQYPDTRYQIAIQGGLGAQRSRTHAGEIARQRCSAHGAGRAPWPRRCPPGPLAAGPLLLPEALERGWGCAQDPRGP